MMKLKIVLQVVSLLCFVLPVPVVFADTSGKPVTLDTVVVTAEKTDNTFQTGDVDTENSPAFYSVINRDQFEGKVEDLSEVIEKESGIQVRQSGGLGSFSSISLRGSSGEQVMVFMDGILLNDASGGGVDLSSISLSDVESVEIYRGAIPANFGRASIGGAVNIRTLRSKKGLQANTSAGYGSFNTQKLSGFINHKPGKWDCIISACYLGADNDFDILNDNGTEYNKLDDRWEYRNNAQFDQKNVLAKFGFDFTDNLRIDLMNQWFSKDQGLPGWRNSKNTKTLFDTTRNITTLKLTADNLGEYHFNTTTQVSFSRKKEVYDDRKGHVGQGKQFNEYISANYDASFFLEWLTDFNTLNFIMDTHYEKYDFENLLNVEEPEEKSRKGFSIGLQDSFFAFQEKLVITPAIRYAFLEDESEEDEVSRDEEYFDSQIGLKYCPFDWLTFKSNLAKYVRVPSFFELFGDRGFFLGNDELKAEKGVNIDAGFEISSPVPYKHLSRLSFSAVGFRNDVDDLINRVYGAQGVGKSVNTAEAVIKGIETEIKMDIFKHFRIIANATWQDTENRSQQKDADGKKLPGRFEESYMVKIEANLKGFKISSEYIAEKDMYYDTPNLLKALDREEINIAVSWLFEPVLLNFEAKNIGDNQYEDYNGYPMPGRSYFFSVKYSF
ncbi:MAG: TonB-dependent receptor [Desulfobacteraceae bacterium]|nr:TonB-dependent receptor [Desulfobacteraceae bacterium]